MKDIAFLFEFINTARNKMSLYLKRFAFFLARLLFRGGVVGAEKVDLQRFCQCFPL